MSTQSKGTNRATVEQQLPVDGVSVDTIEEVSVENANPSSEPTVSELDKLLAELDGKEDNTSTPSADAVVAELLSSGRAKRYDRLHVVSVSPTQSRDSNGQLMFDGNDEPIYRVLMRTDGRVLTQMQTGIDPDTRAAIYGIGYDSTLRLSVPRCAQGIATNPDFSIFADDIRNRPSIIVPLFAGATIDVIAEYIPANTPWRNPFVSESVGTTQVFDTPAVKHHIVAFHPGKNATKLLDTRFNAFATMQAIR